LETTGSIRVDLSVLVGWFLKAVRFMNNP